MYLVFWDSNLIYYIISRFSLFTSVTYGAIVVKTREKEPSSLLRVFSRISSVHVAPSGDIELLCFLQLCLLWPRWFLLMIPSSRLLSSDFIPLPIPLSSIWDSLLLFIYLFCKRNKLSFPDLSRKMQHDSRKAFFLLFFFKTFFLTSHSYHHVHIYFLKEST